MRGKNTSDLILANIRERLNQSWMMSSYIEEDSGPLDALTIAVRYLEFQRYENRCQQAENDLDSILKHLTGEE